MRNYTCELCGCLIVSDAVRRGIIRCDSCRKAAHARSMDKQRARSRRRYWNNRDKILKAQLKKHAEQRKQVTLICPHCGVGFHAINTLKQKYCSEKCMRAATRDTQSRECSAAGCSRPVRARGMCSMHYHRWRRSEGIENDQNWNERRRRNYERRRALKKTNGDVDSFDNFDVFDRDGWVCGICGEPVDKALQWPDPMSVSLDHIVPLSKGGSHTLDNVQCAHLCCNMSKRDLLPCEIAA